MDRRVFLAGAGATLMSRPAAGQSPVRSWQTLSLAEAGFRPDASERVEKAFAAGQLKGLHGLVVLRHGKIAMEHYFAGEDEIWGDRRGTVAFNASVSKSVVGLLYGIALADGLVPKPDAPMLASFTNYPDLAADADRQGIRIEHALTMSMGLVWDENLPYTDPRNSEIAMEHAADRYRFILERPIARPPGEAWSYSGGATAVLGLLVARGSGQRLGSFAADRLFAPLGIEHFAWTNGTNGEEAAASGLRLRPRDLAAIGQLVLDKGSHGGRQIVPADWLERSLPPQTRLPDGLGYGYQWYIGRDQSGAPWYAAFGNGGQRVVVAPRHQLVIAMTAGNYNVPDSWKMPVRLTSEFVFGALAP